jgi:hypothetical protein
MGGGVRTPWFGSLQPKAPGPNSLSVSFTSIETMRTNMALPSCATPASRRLRATSTSRHAAHSKAEPREISRKRHLSTADLFPLPSAMLLLIEHEHEHEHEHGARPH